MPNSSEVSNWYIHKFYILSNSRQFGMSANPIALSEIIFYGSAIGTIGTLEEFIEVMQELDRIYLSGMNASKGTHKGKK